LGKSYKIYNINCALCSSNVLTYHKYGAGKGILRLYFKHIAKPKSLVDSLYRDVQKNLKCAKCENVLGVKDVKRGQLVYRMRKGYFHRKLDK